MILSAVFLFSVLVRLPQLNRPLSFHHEFNTAMFLVTLTIWDTSGAAEHGFTPVMTFDGAANEGIAVPPIQHDLTRRNGDYYYLSFPALAYLLPYAAFQMAGVAPTTLALQLFNLLIHYLCACLIFAIAWRVVPSRLPGRTGGGKGLAGVAAGSIYLCAPALLWFHGNVYVFDTLVLLFNLAALAVAVPMLTRASEIVPVRLALMGVAIFAGVLTEYSAVLLAALIAGMAIWRVPNGRRHLCVAAVAALAVAAGLGLTWWQYSSQVGSDAYVQFLRLRFVERAGVPGSHGGVAASLLQVVVWYGASFAPVLLGLVGLGWLKRRGRGAYPLSTGETVILILSVGVVLLHHLLLLGWTVRHDYSVTKAGIPIALWAAMLLARIPSRSARRSALRIGMPAVILLCVLQYTYINPPGPTNVSGKPYDYMSVIGETIRTSAGTDEVVFVTGHEASPQIVYYARRNVKAVPSRAAARAWLREHPRRSGLLVEVEGFEVRAVDHLRTD